MTVKIRRPYGFSSINQDEVVGPQDYKETWQKKQIWVAGILISAGSLCTLFAKWADRLKVNGNRFHHPLTQTLFMFLGELTCLLIYVVYKHIKKRRSTELADSAIINTTLWPKWGVLIFVPPAVCDLIATSVMYLGLNLTNAASFQMLRGTVVIFTGILSVLLFRLATYCYRWLGIFAVVTGMVLVSVSDVINSEGYSGLHYALTGDILIVAAQAIVAIQIVYEQKYVYKYSINPFLAVGLEGLFGTVILCITLIPLYFVKAEVPFGTGPDHRLEDLRAVVIEIGQNPLIIVALLGTLVTIIFFKPAGVSIAADLSGTTRMVLDSSRILVVWIISLCLSWQQFSFLQLAGFVVLLLGACIYNDVLIGPSAVKKCVDENGYCAGCAECCYWYYRPAVKWQSLEEDQEAVIATAAGGGVIADQADFD